MQPTKSTSWFTRFAKVASRQTGRPKAFIVASLIIAVWAISGPIFHFSDTWQLVINTGTTIVTFLMVFLIQNTQNRDSTAMHLKLDEIIFALDGAHNTLMNLEDLEDKDLQAIQRRYKALAEKAQGALEDEDLESAAGHLEKLAAVNHPVPKNGGSARTKKRAEHNRKRG